MNKTIIFLSIFLSTNLFAQIKLEPEEQQPLPKEHIEMLHSIMKYNGSIKAHAKICSIQENDILLFEKDTFNKLNDLNLPMSLLVKLKDSYTSSYQMILNTKNRTNTNCPQFEQEFKKIKAVL